MTSAIDKVVSPVMGKATSLVTPRTLLVSVVPVVTFWFAAFALTATQFGWASVQSRWQHLDVFHRYVIVALAMSGLAISAAVLSAAEHTIVTCYEGYWNYSWQKQFRDKAAERQKERRKRMASEDRHRFFASETDFMPTRLGNILRAAESYPYGQQRYRIDSVLWWPRFFMIIPEALRSELSSARASMMLRLHMSAVSTVFVVYTGLAAVTFVIAARTSSWLVWCITILAAALMAVYAYRRALRSALLYADLVRSTFDLYRGDVLNRMGFALPETLEEERHLWSILNKLLSLGGVDTVDDAVLDKARARYVSKPAK